MLCDTIQGLLNQRSPAFEIIVVDQTPEQPAEVSAKLKEWEVARSIICIRQNVPNASAARNRGAEHALGDVLLFMDDDVQVKCDFLEAYEIAFADPSVRGVAGQVLEPGESPLESLPEEAFHPKYGWLYFNRRYNRTLHTTWVVSCNAAVRREDFFEVGGMDENYFRGAYREEADFAQRWLASGRDFLFCPRAGLIHLGGKNAPGGGARNWTKTIPGWHHYIGSWYFFLGFADRHTAIRLLMGDLRSAGLSKHCLWRPWLALVCFIRWVSALPVAVWLRLSGPRLTCFDKQIG